MRVTDRLIYDNANRWTGDARSRVEEATTVASSGLRVQQPGDDPAAAGQLTLHAQAQARASAIATATQRGTDELNSADSALDSIATGISRARALAVQLSNATYTPAQRAAAASEIDGIFSQVVSALNTEVGGRYIFGGTQDSKPPFDAATGAYQGDTSTRKLEIAPGVWGDASVRADVALKGAGGGVDVLSTLQALSAALSSNNVAGVQGSLDGLTAGTAQVASARAAAGNAANTLDQAHSIAVTAAAAEKVATSHLEDADVVDAATQLQLAQRALEAAVSASSQSFQLSLTLLGTK
jgi:flagellar hook-associated protein 3 FlgL